MSTSAFKSAAGNAFTMKAGSILIREGDVGRCAYLLLSGRLQVIREKDGEIVVLGDIKPVDIVGELAIFDEMPRSATVVVMEDSYLIELSKFKLKALLHRSPTIAETIIKLLCNKLRESANRLVQISLE
ncbi:MAG: cyclic nucleotide-binding domain-containing protein [Candidatus Omnitrophota bacterium]